MKLRVGSRESRLAILQAESVCQSLESLNPGLSTELVTCKTRADLDPSLPLATGGRGLFVRELEEALRLNRVDVCVHSAKDVPLP
ncbi:MAG: hydroxymethylbilane synthase, partial [Planctomycetota bacterium]|nr:hydroxymethylbilane synthase [Planctomycetota bacterium]